MPREYAWKEVGLFFGEVGGNTALWVGWNDP